MYAYSKAPDGAEIRIDWRNPQIQLNRIHLTQVKNWAPETRRILQCNTANGDSGAHPQPQFAQRQLRSETFMAQFSFTDDLVTGSSMIDGDHRKLVNFVNAFFQSMHSGEDNGHVSKAMNALIAYTGEHFTREEVEMERIRYVAALAHQAEHTKLLKQLIELKQMLDAGGRMNIPAVADFLSGWLRDHILTADKNLAAALKRERSAAPAAQLH